MNTPRIIAATLSAAALLSSMVPAAASFPSRSFLSPAARGIAADVGRTRDVRDLGRLPGSQTLRIGLLMRFRHEAELSALTRMQSEKRSPYYRRFVSVAQWNAYFAPDDASYRRTASVMQRAGFRVFKTYANRGLMVLEAPSSTIERFFSTELHRVVQFGHGERYANVRPARMPAELRASVIAVQGIHSTLSMFVSRRNVIAPNALLRARAAARLAALENRGRAFPQAVRAVATPTPRPVVVQTPSPNPKPDPSESPNAPSADYTASIYGLGPPGFAIGYDYPVQHGYGGTGRAAGSVIDSDFRDSDMKLEFGSFDIPNTGSQSRVCTDPGNACTICDETSATTSAATCDVQSESTLDAEAIRTLAPDAHFIEYLINHKTSLVDINIVAAYERVVNDDVVDAVNSSFGGCETDDPSNLYAVNYIAMEGAAKGITFAASAGDTGGYNCGTYASNGVPQTFINVSSPCAAYYFTCVGGTSYDPPVDNGPFYVGEQAWADGGGGYSVLEPLPDWQVASVAAAVPASVSTLGRDVPDLSMVADAGAAFIGGTQGVGLYIVNVGTPQGSGGTSLASPMFVAMQTTINQAKGSRGGWVNPRLYQINGNAAGYAATFRDITTSANLVYAAAPGYDDATGLGSPIGWALAGEE